MIMIIALALVAAANLIFAALDCFVKRGSPYFALVKVLGLMSLVCLGLTCCSYKNEFDSYTILLVVSVLPLFVTLFPVAASEKQTSPEKFSDDIGTVENFGFNKQQKPKKKFNYVAIANAAAYLAATACIVFGALYLGKESAFGYLAGLFLGAALTFLEFIIKKRSIKTNPSLFLEKLIMFVCVGLLLTSIPQVLLYATNRTNILFSCAALAYAAYVAMQAEFPNRFAHLTHYAAMLLLFSTIIF